MWKRAMGKRCVGIATAAADRKQPRYASSRLLRPSIRHTHPLWSHFHPQRMTFPRWPTDRRPCRVVSSKHHVEVRDPISLGAAASRDPPGFIPRDLFRWINYAFFNGGVCVSKAGSKLHQSAVSVPRPARHARLAASTHFLKVSLASDTHIRTEKAVAMFQYEWKKSNGPLSSKRAS